MERRGGALRPPQVLTRIGDDELAGDPGKAPLLAAKADGDESPLSNVRQRGGKRLAGLDVNDDEAVLLVLMMWLLPLSRREARLREDEAPDCSDLVSRDLPLLLRERADRERSDKHTKLGLPSPST